MGFVDAFSSFFGGVGDFITDFAATPIGGAIGQIGVDFLRNEIGAPRSPVFLPPTAMRRGGQPVFIPTAQPRTAQFPVPRSFTPIPAGVDPFFQGGSTFMPGVIPAAFDIPSIGGFSDLVGGNPGFGCPVTHRPPGTSGRFTPVRFEMVNPGGGIDRFKPAGRVLLDTSDVAGWRKVNKIGRKFARRRPR